MKEKTRRIVGWIGIVASVMAIVHVVASLLLTEDKRRKLQQWWTKVRGRGGKEI